MSREIKFRAWDGEQMVSPDYIDRRGVAHWKEHSIPSSSDKVMQYTGLKDKNGKEIYEGDIVKDVDKDYIGGEHIFVVEHQKGSYNVSLFLTPTCEVIGNIYENPELLK